jgi:hypothetical protein
MTMTSPYTTVRNTIPANIASFLLLKPEGIVGGTMFVFAISKVLISREDCADTYFLVVFLFFPKREVT